MVVSGNNLFENNKLKKKGSCFFYDQVVMRELKKVFKNIAFESRKNTLF
jgi:hypothetical protein